MSQKNQKRYLGDGAYVIFDGWFVVLTAENGIHATDTVVLEPEVLQAFLDFLDDIRAARRTADEKSGEKGRGCLFHRDDPYPAGCVDCADELAGEPERTP